MPCGRRLVSAESVATAVLALALSAFAPRALGQRSTTSSQANNEVLASATQLLRAGKYDDALRALASALSRSPNDVRLRTVEGIAYSMKGDQKTAVLAFRTALKLEPGYQPALRGEAQVLAKQQDPAAIPVLLQILQLDPSDATAREMLGVAQANAGDCPAAIGTLQHSDLAAEHAESALRFAGCLYAVGRFSDAAPVFAKVLAIRPDNADVRYDLALAQWHAGANKDAADTIAPLLERTSDTELLELGADIFEAAGDTPRAVALLRQAIVLDPKQTDAYVRFAELCMLHESYEAGVEMVSAGLTRMPQDPALFLARGMLYGGMAKYPQAEADFHSAEIFDRSHGTGSYGVGLIQAQANHPEQALSTARAGLKSHPENAQLHFLLARLLIEAGAQPGSASFVEATHSGEEAVRLDPKLVAARDLLAKIYTMSGQTKLAIEQCRAALALDPTDQNALYRLMRASREVGDTATAQALARQVAEMHQQTREGEKERLRYRIETAAGPNGTPGQSSAPASQ